MKDLRQVQVRALPVHCRRGWILADAAAAKPSVAQNNRSLKCYFFFNVIPVLKEQLTRSPPPPRPGSQKPQLNPEALYKDRVSLILEFCF